MEPQVVVQTAQAMPPAEIMHTMAAATVLGGLIRLLVALMKLPMFGQIWKKLPRLARPAILLALTAAGFFFDNIVMGQIWYLALGSALTALGGAVVSHEWQTVFGEAATARRSKKKAAAAAAG